MKILQLTYHLTAGGAERFVVDLCNELSANKENEVYLVVIKDDKIPENRHYLGELSPNVNYVCLGCKKGLSLECIRKIYGAIKRIKPDIVHTHTNLIPIFLPAFLLRKPKYVHTMHTLANRAGSKYFHSIEHFLYKKRVQAVTISSLNNSSYKEFYGLKNSICINNGCPTKKTTDKFEEARKEIELLKNGEDIPVFIHVARYHPVKNQQMLFSVFNRLASENHKFLLLVLGDGFEKSELIEEIKTDKIKLLGLKQNVGDYLACADYFVLTSKIEGLPISLIEAMSLGVIPICTPAGGIVDVIDNKKNGYITEDFEEESLYEYIKNATEGNSTVKKEYVIDSYINNYTMKKCADEYHFLYKTQINSKR